MRSFALALALVAGVSATEEAQVGCAAGTYFWGTFQVRRRAAPLLARWPPRPRFAAATGRAQGAVGSPGCNVCAKGQYQAAKGAATCFKCPDDFTTADEGATSKAQCSRSTRPSPRRSRRTSTSTSPAHNYRLPLPHSALLSQSQHLQL